MSNFISTDFFKSIVEDLDAAILYLVPKATKQRKAEDYLIVFANDNANSLFSDTDDSIQNLAVKDVSKLYNFGNLLSQIEVVSKCKNREILHFYFKDAEENFKIQANLKPIKGGLLLSITTAKDNEIIGRDSKLAEVNLHARIHELEISNLFSNRVLDSIDSIICYIKPILDIKGDIDDFRIDYINNRMDEVTNENPKNIIGRTLREYYPENFENGVIEILRECFNTGENKDYLKEFYFNGQRFWLNSRALKMNDGLILFSKDVTREKEYEEQLFIQNRLLSEAESVANIGSFRYNIGKNSFKFSDNVYRLFGFEPNEFESNYERLLSFVHFNDVDKVKTSFKESRINKTKTDLVFRIFTKSKKVKYMNTIGECYQKEENWYMVGVIRDVTQQIVAESNLQTKNAELKRTNSDLEAFNRVASHDLQEPLRKIQMFVSRLNEEEKGRLGSKSLGYLDKVKTSSNRMRNLINNLLSYSKVEEVEELPKSVDLNDVLENVLDDLGERIEELKAEIVADSLPVVNGVQFQLEQLFANLLGNSLKYIKTDTIAKIRIKSALVSSKELPSELTIANVNYVKLQFVDNGIGFEKKYEDKIFEIFQRLHGKTEFSGTGLGLSICKKIVQSHHGIIEAKGDLGKGAVFTVYLPTLI